jgi:ketosteroid isomerase-like protein
MHRNAALIHRFYQAFQRREAAAMAACYHPEVRFSDPAFPDLKGAEAGAMWAMLLARASDLDLQFSEVRATDTEGSARWVASYTFSKTGRRVVNRIEARFRFRDGLIVEHRDHFSFARWARQALGLPGWLMGFTPFLRGKVQAEAAKSLGAWRAQKGS